MAVKYRNGNYYVYFDLQTGTKIRINDEDYFTPDFPESMDIKICNRCDRMCPQCHEQSTPNGALADLVSPSFVDTLRPFTELALGGGNVFEHPDLLQFLLKCKRKSLVPSITVNQYHFFRNYEAVKYLSENGLIYGIGISLENPTEEFIRVVQQFPNAVIHVINGIVTIKQLEALKNKGLKILILGYKSFGRGITYEALNQSFLQYNQTALGYMLPEILDKGWFVNVCFDNLAVQQLNVPSVVGAAWENYYMGEDGFATMYVDMVKREFAVSSTSVERYPLMENINDMFKVVRTSAKRE